MPGAFVASETFASTAKVIRLPGHPTSKQRSARPCCGLLSGETHWREPSVDLANPQFWIAVAQIIAIDIKDDKLEQARKLGADGLDLDGKIGRGASVFVQRHRQKIGKVAVDNQAIGLYVFEARKERTPGERVVIGHVHVRAHKHQFGVLARPFLSRCHDAP